MYSAVIVGSGPAGTALAVFLARRGHRVALIERAGEVEDLQPASRSRSRHVQQGHSYLALGTQVLGQEMPDLVDSVLQAGAGRVPLRYDPAHWNLLVRRPILDSALQKAARAERSVDYLKDVQVTGLIFEDEARLALPLLLGVRTTTGDIRARYVVDATGRRSPFGRWLRMHGIELPAESHPTRHIYITRHYRMHPAAAFPSFRVPVVVALPYAAVLAFPEDNGHFQISVQMDGKDPLRRRLLNANGFQRFLAEVPMAAAWLDAGEPSSEPLPCASVGNHRTYMYKQRPLIAGLLLVGDAAAFTNPTAGRGISLALAHAQRIAAILDNSDGKQAAAVCHEWEMTTSHLIDPWLASQIRMDAERQNEVCASIAGQAPKPAGDPIKRVAEAMAALHGCPIVGAAADRLLNMLELPSAILADSNLMRRVLRQTRTASNPGSRAGPSRAEFNDLMTSCRRAE